jgi:hypothetical protein
MRLVFPFAAVLLASLVTASEPPRSFKSVTVLDRQGMIIPEQLAGEFGLPFRKYWTPSETEIKQVELRLPAYVKSEIKAAPRLVQLAEIGENLPRYRRQYVGVIEKGRKLILINALRPKPSSGVDAFENWDRQFIDVSDGGSQFWSALYDVENSVFRQLNVHGKG